MFFSAAKLGLAAFDFFGSPAHNDYGLGATFKPFIGFFSLCGDVVIDLIPSISPILLSPIGV